MEMGAVSLLVYYLCRDRSHVGSRPVMSRCVLAQVLIRQDHDLLGGAVGKVRLAGPTLSGLSSVNKSAPSGPSTIWSIGVPGMGIGSSVIVFGGGHRRLILCRHLGAVTADSSAASAGR
jgi:hypothetical protein